MVYTTSKHISPQHQYVWLWRSNQEANMALFGIPWCELGFGRPANGFYFPNFFLSLNVFVPKFWVFGGTICWVSEWSHATLLFMFCFEKKLYYTYINMKKRWVYRIILKVTWYNNILYHMCKYKYVYICMNVGVSELNSGRESLIAEEERRLKICTSTNHLRICCPSMRPRRWPEHIKMVVAELAFREERT